MNMNWAQLPTEAKLFLPFSKYFLLIFTQGVLRVRKRVTLMAVIVSVIFGICWGTDVVIYTLKSSASCNIGPVPVAIANTMVLFHSAVNPFVYALLNQQFWQKTKRMICCKICPTNRIDVTGMEEAPDVQRGNSNTQPTQMTVTIQSCSLEQGTTCRTDMSHLHPAEWFSN